MLLQLTNMLELQQIEANTSNKIKEPGILSGYTVLKILLNRDYLVKDKFQEKYLLCHSTKRYDFKVYEIGQSHMVKSIQFIKDENSYYQVFPMSKKLSWAGDIIQVRNKSQIYALALLYSSIRYIIKPLLALSVANSLIKFICIDNLWFKGTSSYLFLCNRHIDKNIQKTENQSIRKYLPNSTVNHQKTQANALSRMGQVFWDIFFSERQQNVNNQSKKTFKQIIKLMLKGEVKLAELQSIMQDKITKKRFVSSLNSRKCTIDHRDLKQQTIGQYQTIQQNIFSKLENIPISAGKPFPGLLFQKKGAQYNLFNHKHYNTNNRASLSIDQQDNIYPPSFYKVKRPKRMSLFSGTKNSRSNRYDETSRQQQNNALSINKKNCERSPGESLDTNRIGNSRTVSIQNHQKYKTNKEKRQLRKFFDQNLKNLGLRSKSSKIQLLQVRSRDKALQKFKKSIEVDKKEGNNEINDGHFISNLRYKRHQNKKIVQISLIKAQEYFNSYYLPLNQPVSAYLSQKIDSLQNSRIKQKITKQQNTKKHYLQQRKIYNEDLFGNQRQISRKVQITQPIQFSDNGKLQQRINEKEQKYSLSINETNKKAKPVQNYQNQIKKPSNTFLKSINQQPLSKSKLVQQQSIVSNNFSFNDGLKKRETDQNVSLSYSRDQSKIQFYNLPPKIRNNDTSIEKQKVQQEINDALSTKQKMEQTNSKNKQKQLKQIQKPNLKTHGEKIEFNKDNNVKQQAKAQPQKPEQKFKLFGEEQVNLNKIEQPKTYDVKQKKQLEKKQQIKEKEVVKIDKAVKKQKIPKKEYQLQMNDEIQQIQLVPKIQINNKIPANKIDINKTNKPTVEPIKSPMNKPEIKQQDKKGIQQKKQPQKIQKKKEPSEVNLSKEKQDTKQVKKQRLKTGQSNASSNGGKSVKKQIDEYIYMINKMGEAVAKTSKLSKKLQKIQWFTGVYFLYKRFFYQRKKIQKYLNDQQPKLTRYEPFNSEEWKEWLSKGEKTVILNKCREDNANIQKSIKKMSKKIQSMQLPASVLLNININKNIEESSRIAVEYIVDEYDQVVEHHLLQDGQVLIHICEMINSLFVMAQIDGKVKEKRPVLQFGNIKRSKEELSQLAQKIFDLYEDM